MPWASTRWNMRSSWTCDVPGPVAVDADVGRFDQPLEVARARSREDHAEYGGRPVTRGSAGRPAARRCRRRAPAVGRRRAGDGHSTGASCWYSNVSRPAAGWRKRRRRVSNWATPCSGHHAANSSLSACSLPISSTNSGSPRWAVVAARNSASAWRAWMSQSTISSCVYGIGEQHPQQVALDPFELDDARVQAGLGGVPGEELPARSEHVGRRRLHRLDQPHRARSVPPAARRPATATAGRARGGARCRRRRAAGRARSPTARRARR